MAVGFVGCLLFLFVPESFWDRTPVPRSRRTSRHGSRHGSKLTLNLFHPRGSHRDVHHDAEGEVPINQHDAILEKEAVTEPGGITTPEKALVANDIHSHRDLHVGFVSDEQPRISNDGVNDSNTPSDRASTPINAGGKASDQRL